MTKRKKKRSLLSEQLKKAIEDSDFSQYRIAKETGVAQSTISQFLNGKRSLSLANIDKLCEFLGLQLTNRK